MPWYTPTEQHSFFARLPKVDLHRHLEGSLRLDTILDIARKHSLTVPVRPTLARLVQVQPEENLTFANFLSKFQTLHLLYRSPEILNRITGEAVEDAAADGVAHLELHVTPTALGRTQSFPLGQVINWVVEGAYAAGLRTGISVRLVISINRHEPAALAETVADLAAQNSHRGVVGLDLAGDEARFPAEPFLPIFRAAKQAGLRISIHAGEWGGAEHVRQAIEDFEADRVAHGVRVLEDERITALARERQTAFDVCVTANTQSGVVADLPAHPAARMIAAGLNVTFNTDDPSISQITLTDEYRLACEQLGLSRPALAERIRAAARAAFLPQPAIQRLLERIQPGLAELEAAP